MLKRQEYIPATEPMKHQIAAIQAAFNAPARPSPGDNFAFIMDMGTGKSKVVLDEWGAAAMRGDLPNLLVVAPAGSYSNWYRGKSELSRSELDVHLDPALRSRLVVGHWRSGAPRSHMDALTIFLKIKDRPRALFVNVEALSSVPAAQELVSEYLKQGKCYMAIDESTVIKNPDSLRSKFVYKVGELADCRRIMTGFLTPRSPLDAFGQFYFLDWRILGARNWFGFKLKHSITKRISVRGKNGSDKQVNIVVDYRNTEEISERIRPYSFRVMKEDCLDLPAKVFLTRDVQHTKEQAKAYKELKEQAMTMISTDAYASVDSMLQLMIRLHQINLGYIVDSEGRIHDMPEQRTEAIIETIDQHDGKTIVWSPFIHRIETLERLLKQTFGDKSVAKFYGPNRSTRHDEEARFIGDPDCKIMIASQPAGGRGNTWVVANLNIYDSNNYDLEQRLQSEDRAHRKGQTKSVTYVDMITEGTVDLAFVKSLRNKYTLATTITGEKMRAWI
jgi:hypothetical protein